MNVRTLKDSVGAVFSPKVSADSVYLSGSETNLTTKLNNIDSHAGNSDIHITSSEKTSWNNKYDKPSSGIPKTDLASEVQTSLGKADTALQAHQDISGKEDKVNKIHVWSPTPSNTYYPSEKLVKSALDGKAASSHTHTKSQITDFPSSMPASDVYAWAKAANKPSYAWSEITSKPTIPSKTSQLTNDSGFLTSLPSHTHNYAGSASAGGSATSSLSIAASSQLTSATAVDGFLEANKFKYATFANYSSIGFIDNNGIIISIPWTDTRYGIQIALDDDNGMIKVRGKLADTWGSWKQLWKSGDAVTGAVWNDLIDCIDIPEDDIIESGYCYCMNEDGHYRKSEKYLDNRFIGIDSDTYSLAMNMEPEKRKLNAAVSGFVLAYVDKEYPIGTALTCTENGYLTEIKKEDKCYNPERIIATYWKNEERKEIVKEDRTVKVNGRKWVKIK